MRRLLSRLCLSALSLLATLFVLEIGVRLISPQDPAFWDSDPIRRNQKVPPHFLENIPNGRTNLNGVPVAINSLGLRGDEITIPKPGGTFRVIGFGDSVTFGYGMRLEDTYLKVLEARLQQEPPLSTRYEVLNSATMGGGLGDYYHSLSTTSDNLQPDLVLVGLVLNDILVYSVSGSVEESRDEWKSSELPLARRPTHFLLKHSHLFMFFYSHLKLALYESGVLDMNKVMAQNFGALQPDSPHQRKAWESSLAMLSRISEFCRDRHYRLMVVVFPLQMQLSPVELNFYREKYHLHLGDDALKAEPQKQLREFAAAQGITLVDLFPAFHSKDPEQLYLHNKMIPSDAVHPSVFGNQVAADEIFRALKKSLVAETNWNTATQDAHRKLKP